MELTLLTNLSVDGAVISQSVYFLTEPFFCSPNTQATILASPWNDFSLKFNLKYSTFVGLEIFYLCAFENKLLKKKKVEKVGVD